MGFFGKKEEEEEQEEVPQGKYPDACSVCNKAPSEKKWMGQYFHKKCLRKMKKVAKGMM